MLNEDTLNALPEAIYQRLNKINTEYLELIGQKVKEIGELSPGDLRKLQRIQTYDGNIERKLEHITEKNAAEIYEIIEAVVKDMQVSAKPVYTAKGIEYIPYAKNKELQRYAKSIAKQTVGELVNLTQHTAFCVWSQNGETAPTFFPEENRYKIPTSLSETYSRVIDEAVTAAQSGLTDYSSAMRKTMRAISDSGIRTVDYATGYSRRLDTAVRQNVLWGIKQCCVGTAEQIGEDIGADGWEISYHSNPRPSHEEMGGRQYAAGDGITVNGKYYPPFSDVEELLKDFNCLHYKFPILLGISEPAYDDDELAAMKENDRRKFEFEGKKYTGYEATQVQRKLETEIRKQKDRANLFAASGDDDGRRAAQEKINLLTKKYKQFSDAAGLPTHKERMSVAGFHRVKTHDELLRTLTERGISGKSKFTTGENGVDLDMLKSKEYKQKFKGITGISKVDNSLYEYSRAILTHRNGTYFEDLCVVDAKTGRLVALDTNNETENEVKYGKNTELLIKYNPYRYVSIHNHGTNNPPTGSDLVSSGRRKYKMGVAVCHNGDVYVYKAGNCPFTREFFDNTVDEIKKTGYTESEAILKTLEIFRKDYGITWEKR